MRPPVFSDEKGVSLIELLLSLAIVLTVFTAFLPALSTANFSLNVVRERVTAENLARTQLECIQHHPYINHATPISYTNVCTITNATLPAYYTDLSISYWYSQTASTQPFTSTASLDSGMQWITVTIYHNGEPAFTIANYKANRDD